MASITFFMVIFYLSNNDSAVEIWYRNELIVYDSKCEHRVPLEMVQNPRPVYGCSI